MWGPMQCGMCDKLLCGKHSERIGDGLVSHACGKDPRKAAEYQRRLNKYYADANAQETDGAASSTASGESNDEDSDSENDRISIARKRRRSDSDSENDRM